MNYIQWLNWIVLFVSTSLSVSRDSVIKELTCHMFFDCERHGFPSSANSFQSQIWFAFLLLISIEFYIFKIAAILWHPLKFISSSQSIEYTIYCWRLCLCPFCAAKRRMILQILLYLWKLIFWCYIILTRTRDKS